MAAYATFALAIAATSFAQELTAPLSTDVTIGLIAQSHDGILAACDISSAPSIHFTGLSNSSLIIFGTEIFWSPSYTLGGNTSSSTNVSYTLSNADKYSNDTFYSGLYYEQLGGSTNTVGVLEIDTYPCSNGAMICDEGGVTGSEGYVIRSNVTVGQTEKVAWNCYAKGACYQLPYDIKGFNVGTAVNKGDPLSNSESDGQCLLEAVVDSSNPNNTINHNNLPKSGASKVSGSSIVLGSSIGSLAASMLLWV